MTNLNSSWESSVVKLAQAGNLKAITFWLNRYLVPQGLCAQVIPEQPGVLLVRVVCHRLPDCDRLVQFVRQRFLELNSEMIYILRITAQQVGVAQLLWEQSVPIRFPVPKSDPGGSMAAPAAAETPAVAAAQNRPAQIHFAPRPIPRDSSPLPVKVAAKGPVNRGAKPYGRKPAVGSNPGRPKIQSRLRALGNAALDQWDDARVGTIKTVRRSQKWFKAKPSEVRAMLVGGSIAATVAIGCSVQIASQILSQSDSVPGLWGATLTEGESRPQVNQAGTVQAALERVPVIRHAVQNAADPTVTLMFAGNAALAQTTQIEAYQQADLLMSHLDNLLAPVSSEPTGSNLPNPAVSANPTTKGGQKSSAGLQAAGSSSEVIIPSGTIVRDSASVLVSSASYLGESEGTAQDGTAQDSEPALLPPAHLATQSELLASGVDIVNLATDQLTLKEGLDNGNLAQTLNALAQNAIYPVGAGSNEREARRPQIFEVKGQKIAFVGYSDSDLRPAGAQTAGLNTNLNGQLEADIKAIRDQVDWVIVTYRWNQALRTYPEATQVNLTRTAIDHGADLVVGFAPQITQGAEIYSGRPIVYALGDDVDDYSDRSSGNYETAALKVTLRDRQMQVEFVPIQVRQNQSAVAEGEAAARVTEYLQQASSLFDRPLRSPLTLDARMRLSFPTAPDADLPAEPFLGSPSGGAAPQR